VRRSRVAIADVAAVVADAEVDDVRISPLVVEEAGTPAESPS
jgi:hypothetical protein